VKPYDNTRWLGRARRFGAATSAGFVLLLLAAAPAQAAGTLSLVPELPVLFALIVGFVLLVLPLNKAIFKPLFTVVDERNAKIEGARQRASRLEEEAGAAIRRYRGAIRDAREGAEAGRRVRLEAARSEQGSITGEARSEAEQEIARARSEIVASIDEARASLRGAAEELAQVAAERILGRSIT
jgi:F-type H+-transporting ATPase subunit b